MDSKITFLRDGNVVCFTLGRLRTAIEESGHLLGLRGNCLADVRSRLGTHDQELLASDLYLGLPARIRRPVSTLAREMVRALVLTHYDDHDKDDIKTPASSSVNESQSRFARTK